MGCCQSSPSDSRSDKDQHHFGQPHHPRSSNGTAASVDGGGGAVPGFSEYSLAELKTATNNFSSDFIVSESGEKAPNVVYKGRLQNRRWIAVKKFTKVAWPDHKQFAEEARGVGKLRYKRLANLIGYCCEGDERLLVAEFMPNDTLAKHLFHWHTHVSEALKVPLHIFFTMPWTPTNEFPHPLSRVKQPVAYRLSYQIVDALLWLGMRDVINEFRKKKLQLRPITYLCGSSSSHSDVPYGYIWSPHLVPKPKDSSSFSVLTACSQFHLALI